MKKIGFILLIMMLPLQSAWAAVQVYHDHGSSASLVDIVFHDHSDLHHDHTHDAEPEQTGSADHHHCHAHTVSVLNHLEVPHFPPPGSVRHSRVPEFRETLFSQRIERPNWR